MGLHRMAENDGVSEGKARARFFHSHKMKDGS